MSALRIGLVGWALADYARCHRRSHPVRERLASRFGGRLINSLPELFLLESAPRR